MVVEFWNGRFQRRAAARVCAAIALAGCAAVSGPMPSAGADIPDGCRAWGVGSWSSANCDASVGGEYRAEAYCTAFNAGSNSPFGYVLPFNDREYGAWHPAGSGQDSTAQCDGGYYMSQPLVQTRP